MTIETPNVPSPLTKDDLLINSLAEHITNNADCLDRLILLIMQSSPLLGNSLTSLRDEWEEHNREINEELIESLQKNTNTP
ncbi:MAG: hypothetical protein DRG78_16055 [Epsilonproteobacteria bacterium]|nr:MAG: hypothetical protein DRG78_16055 [Campylobacterota bacterium]